MSDPGRQPRQPLSLKGYTLILASVWTAIVIGSFFWRAHNENDRIYNMVRTEARSAFKQHLIYRTWNAGHGGVYVPITENTQPNPHLSHLKERDIVTPSGRKLTLINPAYMTRQVTELGKGRYGVFGHITSLNPIRPDNAPDEWEAKALQSFERGAAEITSVESINGEPFLRLMRPLITERGCLSCHAVQGYKEGEIRGGISISTPLEPYLAASEYHTATDAVGMTLLWGIGLLTLGLTVSSLHRRVRERFGIEQALHEKSVMLDNILRSSRDIAIVTTDLNLRVTYCNPTAERIFGKTAKEVVSNSIKEIPIRERPLPGWFEYAIQQVRTNGEYSYSLTLGTDDEPRNIDARISCISDNEDKPVGYSFFCRDVTERRKTVTALRESEERYRAVAEDMPVMICRFLPNGEITYVNEACCRYFDKNADELVGSHFIPSHSIPGRESIPDDIKSIDADHPTCTHEQRVPVPGGELRWQRWTTRGLFDETGQIVAYQSVGEDITSYKCREETTSAQLRLSEFAINHQIDELLELFLNEAEELTGSEVGFYHFVDEDQVTLELQAWSTNTLQNMCKAEGRGAHYSINEAGVWVDCVREGKPVIHNDYASLPHRRGLPEGHAPVIRELVVPVYRGDKIVAILGVGNKKTDYVEEDVKVVSDLANTAWDIVGHKRAERDLHRSQEQVHLLLNSTAEAIYGLDLDGNCTLCNPACLRMLGYNSVDQLIGRNMHDLIHHTRTDGTLNDIQSCRVYIAFKQGKGTHIDDEVFWRADGTCFPVEYWSYPIHRDGQVVGAVVTFLDITERKQAEDERRILESQLRQSQKLEAVGQLAGGIAHDFNNILTVLFGSTAVASSHLKSKFPEATRAIEALQEIKESTQRASALTRQLLTFSRQNVVQPKNMDLNAVLANLEKMLRCLITEDITMDIEAGQGVMPIWADVGQIEQVVVNLVVNATHAMPDGGHLQLETRRVVLDEEYTRIHAEAKPGPHVMLAVSDTGIGMDAATIEHIFEPFFTTKPVDQGTGLGLATVHGIVKQSDGHIEVYSEPGSGTTFKIYIPATETADAEHAPTQLSEQKLRGDATILLCEDDESVRKLTAQSLRAYGYTVLTAGRSQDAIEVAKTNPGQIDMLLSDVILPDFNGRQLAEQLTATYPHVCVLFMSGYTANVISKHGVLDEGVEFLEKPFTKIQLLTKVHEVLAAHRANATSAQQTN